MTLPTHVAFASVLYLGGATLFGYRTDGVGWLLAAVASGLPDVDLPTSKIGRLFFWLSEKVEMRGRTLRWLLSKVDQRRVYFLNGEMQTGRVEPVANIDLYRPVTYSGPIMTLRYARAQELGPWLDLVAAKGEIFVQFWLRPGEQAVAFDLGNDPPADPIPAELRAFL